MSRSAFYVSDGSGLTAEVLGHSLLAQFEGLELREQRIGGVDSFARLYACVDRVRSAREADGAPPLVFATLVHPEWAQALKALDCVFFDLFETFLAPLESALNAKSSRKVREAGKAIQGSDLRACIEAIHFALAHDDGASEARLAEAQVILVGVSRSGKTPTCLYLAMQHAVKAANYPLIPEDFERGQLPPALVPFRAKLFGLTLAPERLSQVRTARRPESRYAALENCRYEVAEALKMMRREGIQWLDSSARSVEELAAEILAARLPSGDVSPSPSTGEGGEEGEKQSMAPPLPSPPPLSHKGRGENQALPMQVSPSPSNVSPPPSKEEKPGGG